MVGVLARLRGLWNQVSVRRPGHRGQIEGGQRLKAVRRQLARVHPQANARRRGVARQERRVLIAEQAGHAGKKGLGEC